MARNGIIFCMRYPDDEGFVWRTVARLRDMVAGNLAQYDCFIAFPRLTGNSVHRFDHLRPITLDCYGLDAKNRDVLREMAEAQRVVALVYMSALPTALDMGFLHSLGLATINTEEDSFDPGRRDPIVKRWAKFVLRRVLRRQIHTLHIANSIAQGEWLVSYAQFPPDRVVTIPNGVDCTRFTPEGPCASATLDPAKRWVICAGQARPEKRVDLILRSAARILAQPEFADVGFVYVGDGELRTCWQELARDLGIASRVRFVGSQADLAPFYRSSSIMAHAAEVESFGLVLAEAMACGLPVVACAAAGPCELIVPGETGTLVGLNDEDAFLTAIEAYLRDPNMARAHGKAGRQRAEAHFSIHRQATDMAAAIRQVIEA